MLCGVGVMGMVGRGGAGREGQRRAGQGTIYSDIIKTRSYHA